MIDAEIFVFIDGDGTYLPIELDSLVKPILDGEADMVIGSRLKGEMEKDAMTMINKFGNKFFNFFIRRAVKFNIRDVLSGYRAVRGDSLKEIVLFSEGFEIEAEITLEFLGRKLRVMEVPISYKKRHGSLSKLQPFKDGVKIFKTLFYTIMNFRPLFFFSLFSSIFFLVGIYPTVLILYEKIVFGDIYHLPSVVLSALLFISGGIVLVLGILADLIVSTRRRMEYIFKKLLKE